MVGDGGSGGSNSGGDTRAAAAAGAAVDLDQAADDEALASLRGLSLQTSGKGEGEEEDRALGDLFLEGQALVEALEEGTDNQEGSEARRRKLERALKLFAGLKTKVAALGLGRAGEEVEDLSTSDLKFVLVDYYLGRLQQQVDTAASGPRGRKACLEVTQRHYERFMAQCERLRLLRGEDLRAWEAETAQDEAEGGSEQEDVSAAVDDNDRPDDDRRRRALLPTAGAGARGGGGGVDPAVARERKIERFRRERAGRERLKELNALYAKLAREAKGDEDALAEKEEVERERVLLWLGACTRRVLDEWPLLRQERQILSMMLGRDSPSPSSAGPGAGRDPRERQRGGGVAAAAGKPLTVTHVDTVGGRLRVRQEELRAQVFRPGYNLPTMTLNELAAQEVAEAQAREARARDAPKGPRRSAQLEADGEEDDAQLGEEAAYHDRAWDDWKDDHPRGMGNKAGKRF